MIGSSRALKVWACPAPVDLRKGFDGLAHIVRWQLGKDALSGDCFLFTNRQRQSAKVLVYDGTGLGLYCKRLERGRFACLWKRTQVAALFYSLIETARSVGVDPKAYLLAATRRALADPKSALLPHQFATELAADTG